MERDKVKAFLLYFFLLLFVSLEEMTIVSNREIQHLFYLIFLCFFVLLEERNIKVEQNYIFSTF